MALPDDGHYYWIKLDGKWKDKCLTPLTALDGAPICDDEAAEQ